MSIPTEAVQASPELSNEIDQFISKHKKNNQY